MAIAAAHQTGKNRVCVQEMYFALEVSVLVNNGLVYIEETRINTSRSNLISEKNEWRRMNEAPSLHFMTSYSFSIIKMSFFSPEMKIHPDRFSPSASMQSNTSLVPSLLKVVPGRVRFQRVCPRLFLFAIAGCPERQTELIERRPRKKNTLSPERDG